MFEGVVAGLLNRLLGKYVLDLDTEHLNVGIFSGCVNLTDLKLKPEALFELNLPIDVKIGTIGRISLQIPWSGLYSQPVVVNVEDVLLLVGPAISNTHFDPEREKRLLRAAKRHVLSCAEGEGENLSGPQDMLESLYTSIVNNLQIYVRNVHIRYEDSVSSKDGPLACGLCLQSLSIETTNSKWKPSVSGPGSSPIYQLVRVESLSIYWNPEATVLDDAETAHITPMQYYNWKHYMITGLVKFCMHREPFDFLLKPVSCKIKVIVNRSAEARVPKLLVDAVVHDSSMHLSRRQYLSICNLITSFERIAVNRKYRHLRPGGGGGGGEGGVSEDETRRWRRWWRYAYSAVLEQRVRPYTWRGLTSHRAACHKYRQMYLAVLQRPRDTELQLDLQQTADALPALAALLARERAHAQFLAKLSKEKKQADESDADNPEDVDIKTKMELRVKQAREKSLWSNLSSPEKRRICELIGYVEGAPRVVKPKQYIEHKLNLTLGNCSMTLTNRSKEIFVVTLTQFLVSIETRPSAKAYKVSCRAESIVVEGMNSSTGLCPVLMAERQTSNTSSTLLAVDFEKNPLHCEADYGIQVQVEPFEIVYYENAVQELINFFHTGSWRDAEWSRRVGRGVQLGRAGWDYAVTRQRILHLNIDVKGPTVVLADRQTGTKPGRLMILDVSRIQVKSDLQPSNLALEDATCMELEERLYDRLHADCLLQILFCEASDPWREQRKAADSELHLMTRSKIQVVFSNSIKKDYKLLPRYKLNLSITNIKVNLSDRVVGQLLDFTDNLSLPVPNTVAVPDAGQEDVSFEKDRVREPTWSELMSLKERIVDAYARGRSAASPVAGGETGEGGEGGKGGGGGEPQVTSETSDEEAELYARGVDLPGFEDNVSPHNYICTLVRFIVGEIQINLSRSTEAVTRPYIQLQVSTLCVDLALMVFGPAVQLSILSATLVDKSHSDGSLVLFKSGQGDLANLLYRKVRADCPDFRSHFHSVEQSLVLDLGDAHCDLHAAALHALYRHLLCIIHKIQQRVGVREGARGAVGGGVGDLGAWCAARWTWATRSEGDPPVPPGATKFSYSIRVRSVRTRLWQAGAPALALSAGELQSELVFRANDRMLFKLYLASLALRDQRENTLYPALVWPDEDKVLEVKLVRAAPRCYSRGRHDHDVTADGELRLYVGRLHVVLFYSVLRSVQKFMEPLVPAATASEALVSCREELQRRVEALRTWGTRLNLVIEIHAPVLLLPQKPSSPTLLVVNTGDLQIENFFKKVTTETKVTSPLQQPIIDNILVQWSNVTLSRAIMTLTGSLELQEPILESLSIRSDIKRCIAYQAASSALLLDGSVIVSAVNANLGQRDLAALINVWNDNFAARQRTDGAVATPPAQAQPGDVAVQRLQEFFAQGEPVRKETVMRFTLEGIELKLFTDMDEVLSSPVRDVSHGLAKVTVGEVTVHLERYSDQTTEVTASLQSLLIEDIRLCAQPGCKRILECWSDGDEGDEGGAGISVRGAALLELQARCTRAGRALDLRLDRTTTRLPPPFLVQLARALHDTLPGDSAVEGGVINHGYVGELPPARATQPPCSDNIGYFATVPSSEDAPSLSISIQLRQPEVMLFAEGKAEGRALLVQTEVLAEYSSHSNTQNLVVSLAGLQVLSECRSKLQASPPQVVLKPCDVEFSRSYKSFEEGVRLNLAVSDVDIHVAPTTVHTINDIVEEITSELSIFDDRDMVNDAHRGGQEEEMWSPKKIRPNTAPSVGDRDITHYSGATVNETLNVNIPNVRLLFYLQPPTPVLMINVSSSLSVTAWGSAGVGCGGGRGGGAARAQVWYRPRRRRVTDCWEPLLEPVQFNLTILQDKAYPMSSKLDSSPQTEPEVDISLSETIKKPKKRRGFESESGDEGDTDTEMTFIRSPYAAEHRSYLAGALRPAHAPPLAEDSDEDGDALEHRVTDAIRNLFTDDSSGDDTGDADSSAAEQSETEVLSEREDADAKTSLDENETRTRKEVEHKTVTLQEPVREDSIDSGLETEAFAEKMCIYYIIEAAGAISVTLSGDSCAALTGLINAFTDEGQCVAAPILDRPQLVNHIGPGTTVHLITRSETDLSGNDRVIAVADYGGDSSRPSTPDSSVSLDLPDDDVASVVAVPLGDICGCVSSRLSREPPASPPAAPGALAPAPAAPAAARPLSPVHLYERVTQHRLCIKVHDLDELTVLCPQRWNHSLHVLPPGGGGGGGRYHVVVERDRSDPRTITVRSPLQIRNETAYALELYYRKTDLQGVDVELMGIVRNPFDNTLLVATIAPHDVFNVPLYIAYHCHLLLLPANFESYQTARQGIWWKELSNELGSPRDMICPAKDPEDKRIFAMRIVTVEGVQSHKLNRSIPNYLIRVLPPLAIYNRLPYAIELSIPARDYNIRIEAGEKTHTYIVNLLETHRVNIKVQYLGLLWTGSFKMTPEMTEKNIKMCSDSESGPASLAQAQRARPWTVSARAERGQDCRLHVHAPYWLINKTGLLLHLKGTRSDTIYEVTEDPLLWCPAAGDGGATAVTLRAQQSAWSRAFPLLAAAPGLVVVPHHQRNHHYRLLTTVTLSELCPQLTKIVTFLPYFIVYNETRRHLRFMEENEAADLWIDLEPQECVPFWPQTESMCLHCKYRDSTVVSQHFPINKHHSTVLRMDRGSAILVTVSGGTDRPFTITFKTYTAGDSPVRIDNLCEDLFLKLNQIDSGQVALLSPYQSMLYTWDDPAKERTLMWNIYNNKGKGFVAEFSQDGYGEEKVSFQSVRHTTVVATNSVTSKLSSTLKRLTPKSPSPNTSSSDDSDSSDQPENHSKPKKMRKDKVIVFWVSFMDNYQRVFALTQDERIAYQYRMKISPEKSTFEVYLSLQSVTLSACVQTNSGIKELAFISVTDSQPKWEVHVSHKWKELAPDLATWIEDKYRTDQKKCQLKEYFHVDLEKMQMTKPFFSELRRTYNPGVWVQLRKSQTHSYCHFKLHRFQIDNQLNDAVFPCVVYPAPLPLHLKSAQKPSIEMVYLKQHRDDFNHVVYKHLKVIIQEHCVNLDRGFVHYIFDILNHWNIEEKPAVRLRADLALVHMPLPIIARRSQTYKQKDVYFEYAHISPIKINLSLSSRGFSGDLSTSPSRSKFGLKKENRPMLFNSDLLDYLFNHWGASLCDMKDVVIRLSYIDLRNVPLTIAGVIGHSYQHYWPQLVQQLYVLVLGLKILGNPYSSVPDFTKEIRCYYEPYLGNATLSRQTDVSQRLSEGVARLLAHCAGAGRGPALLCHVTPTRTALYEPEEKYVDLPECLEASFTHPSSIALSLSGLMARPAFDMCRSVTRASLDRQLYDTQLVARRSLPRLIMPSEGITRYDRHAALGQQLFLALGRGHYADAESYVAHAQLPPHFYSSLLVSTQHIFLVRSSSSGSWHIEWVVKLDDLIGVPNIDGNRLIIHIKQDEAVNYYSSDEKIVEIPNPELLRWIQGKIECALILGMEEKRCPAQF